MVTSIIAYSLLALFFLIERFVRTGKESKTLAKSEYDRRSTLFVGIALVLSTVVLGLTPVFTDTFGKIDSTVLGICGILVMAAGISVRFIAVRTLGRFYMRTLRKAEDHTLVTSGLYRYVRHPGYLGILLIFFGAGIAVENYVTLIVVAVLYLSAYVYRIRIEEKMLVQVLGEEYEEYMKYTRHIIPFVY